MEIFSSNFFIHNHPETECDLIICYKDDLNRETELEILELKDYIEFGINSEELKLVTKIRGSSPEPEITKRMKRVGSDSKFRLSREEYVEEI